MKKKVFKKCCLSESWFFKNTKYQKSQISKLTLQNPKGIIAFCPNPFYKTTFILKSVLFFFQMKLV